MIRECPECGGDGRILVSKHGGNDPIVWHRSCPACLGEGIETIPCECCKDDATSEYTDRRGKAFFVCDECRKDALENDAMDEAAEHAPHPDDEIADEQAFERSHAWGKP